MNDYSYRFSLHGEEIFLKVDIDSDCTALWIYQTLLSVNFMLCHCYRIQDDNKIFSKEVQAFIE